MVRNAGDIKTLTKVSPSFIPSLKCNNECSFCMYRAGPLRNEQLDLDDARAFVKTVDFDKVVGWGFYGGEPSIAMDLYQKFYQLLPEDVPKFVITNGSWSRSEQDTVRFLRWCTDKFKIYISSCSDEHMNNQDANIIEALRNCPGIHIKDEDELHPMGRHYKANVSCTEKCIWHKQPVRIGIFPSGDVLLQNCDGAYPIVGHIKDGFETVFNKAVQIRRAGLVECKNLKSVNDITF